MEPLEARCLLATIQWDGGPLGTGTDFGQPVNWEGDVLPGPTDTAVLGGSGNPIVLAEGQFTIASVESSRELQIGNGALVTTANSSTSAVIRIQGGTLEGGSWSYSNANGRIVATSGGGTLRQLTLDGDISIPANSTLTVAGSTRFSAIRLTGASATLRMDSGFVLQDAVIAEGTATGTRSVSVIDGTSLIGATGSLQLAAGTGGNLQITQNTGVTIQNYGQIISAAAGRTLTLNSATGEFTNHGVLEVSSGTLTVLGNWSNPGSIHVSGGVLSLGGAFSSSIFNFAAFVRTGGVVQITGTIQNSGSVIPLTSSTGSWSLQGGTVVGGRIETSDGTTLIGTSSLSTLCDVELVGDLVIPASASVVVEGATRFAIARLTGGSASLRLASNYTLQDEVVVEGSATGTRSLSAASGATGIIAFGANSTVRVASGSGGGLFIGQGTTPVRLLNRGQVIGQAANQLLQFGTFSGGFENAGSLRSDNGELFISNMSFLNTGTIATVNSVFTVQCAWMNTGSVTVTNSEVRLAGIFSTDTFGFSGFSRSGGTLTFSGTWDNTESTLTLTAPLGPWILRSGTIFGGDLFLPDSSLLVPSNFRGTLRDVRVIGTIVIPTSTQLLVSGTTRFDQVALTGNGSAVYLDNSYVLQDQIAANGAASGTRLVHVAGFAASIHESGSILLASSCGGDLTITAQSVYQLTNNGEIVAEAMGRALTINSLSGGFVNDGMLRISSGTLSLANMPWTNSGSIVSTGATVNLAGTWSNPGSLNVTNTTLTLGGSFATAQFNMGSFVQVGSDIRLNATVDNTGSVLWLSTTSGSWGMYSATITGGEIRFADDRSLQAVSGGSSLIDVTVYGDVIVQQSSSLGLRGLTRFRKVELRGDFSTVNLGSSFVLLDEVIGTGTGSGSRSVVAAAATSRIGSSGLIRMAADCPAPLSFFSSGNALLINEGTILVDSPLSPSTGISTAFFTNNGTVRLIRGILSIGSSSWSNSGTFDIRGGALTLAGGMNATSGIGTWARSGGTVTCFADVNNTGSLLQFDSSTGIWQMTGGRLRGGTLAFAPEYRPQFTTAPWMLENVQVLNEIALSSNMSLAISGSTRFPTIRLQGSAAQAILQEPYELLDEIVADGTETGQRLLVTDGFSQVAVGAAGRIRLAANSGGDLQISSPSSVRLDNRGTISVESTVRRIAFASSFFFTNSGVVEAIAGTVFLPAFFNDANTGILRSSGGTIQLGSGIQNMQYFGTIDLRSGGRVVYLGSGTFQIMPSARFLVQISGPGLRDWGRISSSNGNIQLNGLLQVEVLNYSTIPISQTFGVVSVAANRQLTGVFQTVSFNAIPADRKNFTLQSSTTLTVALSSTADFNSDAIVDMHDYLDFVAAFAAGDIEADFNSDGITDFFDYLDFLVIFSRF